MSSNTVSITDNRTGMTYDLPIIDGAIEARSLQKVRHVQEGTGLVSYDPGYLNTATAISRVTLVDGQKGTLSYRGYPIEELARRSNHLEVAYLLINGELPTAAEDRHWRTSILSHGEVDASIRNLIRTFTPEAHPMAILISALAALGNLYPDSKNVLDPVSRRQQVYRLLGQVTSIAAYIYGHTNGFDTPDPDPSVGYIGNFLRMCRYFGLDSLERNPIIQKAMNALFILHADHEQNCSTSVMRAIGSSHADPYSSMAGATAALYGPLHGGANEAVLKMLGEIETKDNISSFLDKVMNRQALLMGFGHRVYKNMDPRATLIKELAYEVFEVTGANPLIDIAKELEQAALTRDYFRDRRLYPNVDFYSGIIYQALGIPAPFYTVLFSVARAVGWLAHWNELVEDPAQKIARPKQIYRGPNARTFIAMEER